MKKILVIILSIAAGLLLIAGWSIYARYQAAHAESERKNERCLPETKAEEAMRFCIENDMNTDFCFFVDFGIHSGRRRFCVWDFNEGRVIRSSLCCHGYGKGSTMSKPEFSNEEGSYCSSKGKYKVGARSYSNYGINVHYKLHGLDETNSNAYRRTIVLHSFDPVPEMEIYPLHLPLGMSQGCPVISNETMTEVDAMLKKAAKPTLLWIF